MKKTSLLPRNPAQETALFFVVATICFFATLAGMIFKSTHETATQWITEIDDQITVRILNNNPNNAEELIADVNGVISVQKLDRDELVSLLQPSFESENVTAELPIPTIFAVTSNASVSGVNDAIEQALLNRNFEASVTSHSARSDSIRGGLQIVRFTSLTIVGLLAASVIGIIIISTRSAIVAQRSVGRVLFLAGARDGFITRVFAFRFCSNIFFASLVGTLLAFGVLYLLVQVISNVSNVEWWLPILLPDLEDFLIPIVIPVVASLIVLVATRVTVLGTLKKNT